MFHTQDFLLTVAVSILWLVSTAVWIQGALGVENTVDDTYKRFQSYLNCSTRSCDSDKPTYGKLWATVVSQLSSIGVQMPPSNN